MISMRARGFVVASFVVLTVLAVWWLPRSLRTPPRNIVLFVLDTVRRDALGCYGNAVGPTPNIDRLASDGVRFDQAVSSSGWTLPAVASLLTGAWPTIHGAAGRGTKLAPIRKELPTAAEVLREAGFETAGYANCAFVSPMLGIDRGFDVFDHKYTYNWDSRRADATIDAVLERLRKKRNASNFFFIHLFDPHFDYDPPPPYRSRYTEGRMEPVPPLSVPDCLQMQDDSGTGQPSPDDLRYIRGLYYGEIAFMDAQIGRFVSALKDLGLYDDALIIVTADHGEEFWDHGGFEHGHSLYDELIHVPLIIKSPAGIAIPHGGVDAPVRGIDVMPTAFSVFKVGKPASFTGRSLVPVMRGNDSGWSAFSESTLYGAQKIAWRGPRFKYIHDLGAGDSAIGELFDWHSDPLEKNDLSSVLPQEAERARRELMSFYAELELQAGKMSRTEVVDLIPERIEQLRSLGYIR